MFSTTQEYQILPRFLKQSFPEEVEKTNTTEHFDEELGYSTRIPHRDKLKGLKEHIEEHFDRPEILRDCILGLSDGLTVPFALAAGLSSLGDSRIVIYGGVAGNKQLHRYVFLLGY